MTEIVKISIIITQEENIMTTSGIYKLEFMDGSFYIGQSVNLKNRIKQHYNALIVGDHHNYKVQEKYYKYEQLPKHSVIEYCEPDRLNDIEDSIIDLDNPLCLNIKGGGSSNFGINAVTAKYHTEDIEMAFLILVENPGISHKEVAEFVGIDISTVHDISAGRNRVFTEIKHKYPEKYLQLLKIKAPNTRGKNTIILQHTNGTKASLVTGEYSTFCKDNGIQTSNLSKVIKGTRNSTMGWTLLETYENI